MKFKTAQQGGVTVIQLEGNLMGGPDASTLNNKLHELVDAGKKDVVIDVAGVELMNSSGLGMLIGTVSTMKNAGGGLKIANASAKIMALIKVTKLTGILETYDTTQDAVASFKK
ncbi:MAG TPA: STAS domain-containing protein [Bacteroidota bacterium]|nr:STAS domain-containing protein [Bacteroidota bacterium]